MTGPDRNLRLQAADHIRRFRDGELTNDQFEDALWPMRRCTTDRAFNAIASAIWGSYDDMREHFLGDGLELPAEARALLDRCILFMQTDFPYRWERENFISVLPLEPIRRLLARLRRRAPGLREGPESGDDWRVWPFSSDAELAQAKAAAKQFPA